MYVDDILHFFCLIDWQVIVTVGIKVDDNLRKPFGLIKLFLIVHLELDLSH